MKKLGNTDKLYPLGVLVVLTLLVEIIVRLKIISNGVIPEPSRVIRKLFQIIPELQEHLYATLKIAMTGFLIAILLSFILAFLMDNSKKVELGVYPLIIYTQTIPLLAIAPLYVLLFGYGDTPKVLVVVSSCFFPIVISLLEGLKKVPQEMLNLVENMGASKMKLFFIVKLPSALTGFFSGLKIAATYCISGAIIGEWLGGTRGLGVYIIRTKRSYSYDKMFATILVIIVLSMALVSLIGLLQRIYEKNNGGKR